MSRKACRNGVNCSFLRRLLKGEMKPDDYNHFNTYIHKRNHIVGCLDNNDNDTNNVIDVTVDADIAVNATIDDNNKSTHSSSTFANPISSIRQRKTRKHDPNDHSDWINSINEY